MVLELAMSALRVCFSFKNPGTRVALAPFAVLTLLVACPYIFPWKLTSLLSRLLGVNLAFHPFASEAM